MGVAQFSSPLSLYRLTYFIYVFCCSFVWITACATAIGMLMEDSHETDHQQQFSEPHMLPKMIGVDTFELWNKSKPAAFSFELPILNRRTPHYVNDVWEKCGGESGAME